MIHPTIFSVLSTLAGRLKLLQLNINLKEKGSGLQPWPAKLPVSPTRIKILHGRELASAQTHQLVELCSFQI